MSLPKRLIPTLGHLAPRWLLVDGVSVGAFPRGRWIERTVDECFPTVTNVAGGGALACAHCGTTNQHVRVYTLDSDGNLADVRFYVTVVCPCERRLTENVL